MDIFGGLEVVLRILVEKRGLDAGCLILENKQPASRNKLIHNATSQPDLKALL